MTEQGDATRQRIIDIIRVKPGITFRDLAIETRRSQASVWNQVALMLDSGMLERTACPTCGRKRWEIHEDVVST